MKRPKGPPPAPINAHALIDPHGALSRITVRGTSKEVRDEFGKHFRGGWVEAKKLGWRTCPVMISALGFEAYR